MGDERFDATEALGEISKYVRRLVKSRLDSRALQDDGEHAAEAENLTTRELVLRMRRQAGMSTRGRRRRAFEELGNHLGVARVLAHSHRQRLRAASSARHRAWPGSYASRVLGELDPIVQLGVIGNGNAPDDVAMAADIFRGRMDDDVRAQRERLLEVWRHANSNIVDRDDLIRSAQRRNRRDVDDVQQADCSAFQPKRASWGRTASDNVEMGGGGNVKVRP